MWSSHRHMIRLDLNMQLTLMPMWNFSFSPILSFLPTFTAVSHTILSSYYSKFLERLAGSTQQEVSISQNRMCLTPPTLILSPAQGEQPPDSSHLLGQEQWRHTTEKILQCPEFPKTETGQWPNNCLLESLQNSHIFCSS